MINPRAADHAVGLELQIEELVEQRERARVQGRDADATAIDAEISALQAELAEHVERATVASTGQASVDAAPLDAPPLDAPPTDAPPAG